MKRHPELRKLSSEHHTGLVLARKASKAALDDENPQDRASVWADIKQRFEHELEPHFQEEESDLLPALAEAGEIDLVERTRDEHRVMRELIAQDDSGNLQQFAELLRAHIRFEEQVLFETAQRLKVLDASNDDPRQP